MMMTYNEIDNKMMKFVDDETNDLELRGAVMGWNSEFGDFNYERMVRIVELMYKNGIEISWDKYDTNDLKEIRELAQEIHDRGGFTALQSNFYTISNFMNYKELPPHLYSQHLTYLKYILNGVGDWKY